MYKFLYECVAKLSILSPKRLVPSSSIHFTLLHQRAWQAKRLFPERVYHSLILECEVSGTDLLQDRWSTACPAAALPSLVDKQLPGAARGGVTPGCYTWRGVARRGGVARWGGVEGLNTAHAQTKEGKMTSLRTRCQVCVFLLLLFFPSSHFLFLFLFLFLIVCHVRLSCKSSIWSFFLLFLVMLTSAALP